MKIKIMPRILCSALLIQLVLLPDFLYSQCDFYRGKTITIIHGRSAGERVISAPARWRLSTKIHSGESHHRA